jgi:hypothetical protein
VDRILELSDTREEAAPDALARDLAEESLDEIEPGNAGRREVELEAFVPGEPSLHRRRLVRSVVVEHEMNIEMVLHRRGSDPSMDFAADAFDCPMQRLLLALSGHGTNVCF